MRTRTRAILAGLALAAALVGGVAWATIPAANGTIQGCYTTSNGNLRVVESAAACRNSETAISWNQQGQRGAAGPAGSSGRDGAPGAKGDPCLAIDPACVGPKGATGAAGANGANGANGKDGANGRDGAKGDACLPDISGCRGPTGDKGDPGAAGAPCLPSNSACVGPQGPPGSSGGGGFTTTQMTLAVQPPGPTDVFHVVQTSPDWGTLEATCKGSDFSTPSGTVSMRQLSFYLSSTATDAHLYSYGIPSSGLIVPRPASRPSAMFWLESRATETGNHSATRYTLVRFGTNPDGSAAVTQRDFALAGEILPDGSCRVTIGSG